MSIIKKALILFFVFLMGKIYSTEKTIGIGRLYNNFKNLDKSFYQEIEDNLISNFAVISGFEKNLMNISQNTDNIKSIIYLWKKNDNSTDSNIKGYSTIIEEIKNYDTCIFFEIGYFALVKEKDFYDSDIINFRIKLNIKIIFVDIKKKIVLDENLIEIDYLSKYSEEDAKSVGLDRLSKKISSYIEELSYLKEEIKITTPTQKFVWIDRGLQSGLKSGNILTSMETEDSIKNSTAIQIIKSYQDKSLANILYSDYKFSENTIFIKQSKINIEILLIGGFSLINLVANQNIFVLPLANIKVLIPIGVVFFNPVVQVDFNFFYRNNKLFLPFIFEIGAEGNFNIDRFQFAVGFLIVALFSPDTDNIFQLDTASLRPYIRLSGILNIHTKLFFESGYKYFIEDNFSKVWKIDLKGVFFNFGVGFVL